jgi:rubrerythrin
VSNEQIALLVIAAAVIIVAVWYYRGRVARRDPDALEFEKERQQAAAASEEVRTEAMLLRVCPVCDTKVESSTQTCPSCGYRFF